MENVGENFANSCRREDKMRREGGRDSFEEEKEKEEEEHKSGDSNYTQDISQKGKSPGYFLLQEKGCKMSRDGFNGPLGRIVLLKSQDASLDRKE